MKREFENSLRSYLVELLVYSALVAGYYFLVLHFLGDWLYGIYKNNHRLYAALALGMIVVQGLVLEIFTRLLLAWLKPHTEAE